MHWQTCALVCEVWAESDFALSRLGAAPSSHATPPAAMSGIQVPPRSSRVDADGQDADGRAQPRRLFTEPSSSNEPEPPRTPEATRAPLTAPLGAGGREPLFAGPSSSYVPETPTTPRTKIRRQLPESWQSPGDWSPEHNINPNPIRRKVFGGLLILGVACIGVVAVGGVCPCPKPACPVPIACCLRMTCTLDSAGRFKTNMTELASQGALSIFATAPSPLRPPLPAAQPPLPASSPRSPSPPPSASHGRRSQSTRVE